VRLQVGSIIDRGSAIRLAALCLAIVLAGGSPSTLPPSHPDATRVLQVSAYRPGPGAPLGAYWTVPASQAKAVVAAANGSTSSYSASANAVLMGAGFARRHFTFDTVLSYAPADGVGGQAILSFQPDDLNLYYGAGLTGLRLMVNRNEDGDVVNGPVLAVGSDRPFTVVAFPAGDHRIRIVADGEMASVILDGRQIWTGRSDWQAGDGIYPKIALAGGAGTVAVSTVPWVRVAFDSAGPIADSVAAVRARFVEAALSAQAAGGRYDLDNKTDAWTATALVYEYRRSPDERIAMSLDRWATHQASAYVPGRSFPGRPGASSINENVGEPGIALALWAQTRGRDDWARIVVDMVAASGWTGCGVDRVGWCRLGNLQPDGSVVQTGEPAAAYTLNHLQLAETAGFIAASVLDDQAELARRRAWIRSLTVRTYDSPPWQFVETLGQDREEHDERPWWMRSRKYTPMMLLLLGMDFEAAPTDPVWSDPELIRVLEQNFRALNWQIIGPTGWLSENERTNFTMGTQELVAAKAFEPLLGDLLSGPARDERLAVQWWRLADGETLSVREVPPEPSGLLGFWPATMIIMLDGAGVETPPALADLVVER
jgi:hypothetical protein